MSAEPKFVLVFRPSAGVGELARIFTCPHMSASFLTRWIAATTPLLNDARGIGGRATVLEAEMVEEGAQKSPFLGFTALVRALGEVCAPAALLYTTWPDRSPDAPNSVRGRMFAPACVAMPLWHAKKLMLPSMATFLTEHDHLSQSVCDDWGATAYGACVLSDEPLIETRDTFPDGTRVTHMAPMRSLRDRALRTESEACARSPNAAPPSESANAVAAKDAPAKEGVAAKDAPATKAVAAKAAKPREIKQLDLPLGGEKFAFDWSAVKSDLHRARMRDVEATDTVLLQKLWRLYANCEASMTLMRQPDRDPLSAHELAFAAGRMMEEVEESLAEFYGTYAIEE